jgi:hypothetical protein
MLAGGNEREHFRVFSVLGRPVSVCEGISRREWLRIGGLGAGIGSLSLEQLLAAQSARGAAPAKGQTQFVPSFGRAKSCILLFMFGAPAHQDTFDMKPDAPSEIRGEFKPIPTNVPGVQVCEHLPRIARLADRFAQVRSVTHPDDTHTVAMHYMLTGRRHAQPATNPRNRPDDFPCFGAVLQYLRPGRALPSGISLNAPANQVSANNHIFPGFFAGILGTAHDPMFVAQDPAAADFHPFPAADATAAARLSVGSELRARVESQCRALERGGSTRAFDDDYRRALALVTSPRARQAFDLTHETPSLRDRYGRNSFGQGLLLARRLVEAGVKLVTVNWARDDAFWDTHASNFRDLKDKLLPPFDLGFSALLEDLDQRGLLDETLVVCLGEFGRTPRINAQAGRDHWAQAMSIMLAGGGVPAGLVYGVTDRNGAFVTDRSHSPADFACTIYRLLGIDPHKRYPTPSGQEVPIVTGGTPISAILGA